MLFGFSSAVIGTISELYKINIDKGKDLHFFICEAHNKSRFDMSICLVSIDFVFCRPICFPFVSDLLIITLAFGSFSNLLVIFDSILLVLFMELNIEINDDTITQFSDHAEEELKKLLSEYAEKIISESARIEADQRKQDEEPDIGRPVVREATDFINRYKHKSKTKWWVFLSRLISPVSGVFSGALFKLDDFDDNMSEDTWTLYNHLFVTRNDKVLLAKFVNKAYDALKDNAHFKSLSMDEQGELCVFTAKMEIKKLKAEAEKIKEIEKEYS